MSLKKKKKTKKCKRNECENNFILFNSLQKYCSFECQKIDNKNKPKKEKKAYRINRVGKKRAKEERIYHAKRIVFLAKEENSMCFVRGCNRKANSVEHSSGRIGSNFLDENTWRPCCIQHNLEFENNTELSQEYQNSKFHNGKKIKK